MSARRLRTDVIRTWRGKAEWAVPLLLFLAILLVAALAFNVANLDTGGEAIPGGGASGGTEPSAFGVFDPLLGDLFLVVFVSFVVAILVHAFLRRRVRQRAPTKPFSWWQVISSAIGLVTTIGSGYFGLEAIDLVAGQQFWRWFAGEIGFALLSKNGASVRSKHSLLPPMSANFGRAIVRKQQIS